MKKKEVVEFYNNFKTSQQNTGINERLWFLYKRLQKLGLKSDSNVLELGCGIGAMTYLISKTVTKGTIESVDISTESIEFARQHHHKPNISHHAADVVEYKPKLSKIDFVTLLDVIEHIPVERHPELFKNISSYINNETLLIINIPNPDYIEYDRKHNPEVLQIIDQPIHHDQLYKTLTESGLDMYYFEKYSIWVKDEYIFYVIKKKQPFTEEKLAGKRSFIEKVKSKLLRTKLQQLYPYGK